ncbi:MAG: GHKL domain-containing protein [Gammaproteobacteria bacterium]|nr:MAG: GHKL domain-containing protein [Gammaproteobacteria bacterium]
MEVAIDNRKLALESAFDDFNRVSEGLTSAYDQLENRVDTLQKELAETKNEKFHQLVEKEKLADRLSILLRTLPVGIVVLDDYGTIIENNEIADNLIGTNLNGVAWKKIAKKYLVAGYSGNSEVCLKNGNRISLKIESQQRSEGKVIIINDVTAEFSYHESINRKERLESLGNMVASLAHQVRTPLSAAFLYVSSLEKRIGKQELSFQLVENVKHCLHSLEETVNDMLSFAKGEWQLNDVISVEQLISNIRNDIKHEFGKNLIEINASISTDNPKASINYIAFWGALKNVIHNAIQASEFDAKVLIEIKTEGKEVVFSVHDKGKGISDELKQKIFEPFFTTKAGGTGLGLAVVKSIVEAHRGTVEIKDEYPQGVCIDIRVPKSLEFSPISSSSKQKIQDS